MSVQSWYRSKVYDHDKELQKIITLGKLRKKHVLVIGDYGKATIAPKLKRIASSVRVSTLARIPSETFDIVVAPWSGLKYTRNLQRVIAKVARVLQPKGIFLIEEGDPTSEYVHILNLLAPAKTRMSKAQRTLKQTLSKRFRVKESKLITYYRFRSYIQAETYFANEMRFHERKRFTEQMKSRLKAHFSRKRSFIVQEKSIFLTCRRT